MSMLKRLFKKKHKTGDDASPLHSIQDDFTKRFAKFEEDTQHFCDFHDASQGLLRGAEVTAEHDELPAFLAHDELHFSMAY